MVDNLVEIIMTLPSAAASVGALRTRYLIACKTDEKSEPTNKGDIIPIIPNGSRERNDTGRFFTKLSVAIPCACICIYILKL